MIDRIAGLAGNATIAAAAQDTIISFGGSGQNLVISGGLNDRIDLTEVNPTLPYHIVSMGWF